MSGVPSAKAIEQVLEKQRAKGKSLDESVSFQLSNDLKAHIVNNSADKLKAILLLATVLRSSKPNELFVNVLDEPLISGILGAITRSIPSEYIMSTFTIILIIIKGEIFQNIDPSEYLSVLIRSLNSNLEFLKVLSTKLYTENPDLMLKSLEFINQYFNLSHFQLHTLSYLIEFFIGLQRSEYFLILNTILQDQRFKQLLTPSIKKLNESFLKVLNTMNEIKVDANSPLQMSMIDEVQSLSFSNEKKKDSNYIINNYSVLQLIDFYFFSQSTNITFKKSYQEQILFNNDKSKYFPLIPISAKITTLLLAIHQEDLASFSNLKKFSFLRDLLHFNTISKFLDIWRESHAEQDELENLLSLIEILLRHVNDELDPEEIHIVDKVLTTFKSTGYEQLREFQLNSFKNKTLAATTEEIASFDKILQDQVFDFIKNQRFLQLSKGAWVFSGLPSLNSHEEAANTNYFFIILSPNFKNLLFKEYKFKTQNVPDIDKTGTPIEISSIASFKIEEIQQQDPSSINSNGNNTRLINLVGKTVINKIRLLNRRNKILFTFFAKKEDSFNYLDGLNLLLGHFDDLSEELTFQINKLFEIRKTVQLLNFDESSIKQNEDVEDVYDLDNLEGLASNFYYS